MLIFAEGGKPENPEKTLRSKGKQENPEKNPRSKGKHAGEPGEKPSKQGRSPTSPMY
jgi:hypothetical protein